MALFGLSVVEQVQPIRTPRLETLGGVARPEPGPGREAGLTFGDVTPGRKSALGRLDPQAWPFSGLACSSTYSQSNPWAGDAMGHG